MVSSFLRKSKIRGSASAYFFIFPFFIFSALFALLPILWVFKLSFQTGGILKPEEWVGLQNYISVFQNSDYLGYFVNSLTFILLTVPFGQLVAMAIAFLLKEKTPASPFFEGTAFLPNILSMVAVGILMQYIFSMSGPVNYVLNSIGIGEVNWFGNAMNAKIAIAFCEVWKGATFHTFVYLAALRAIPCEFYEASFIDGASYLKQMWKITLPLIKNSMMFCFTMTTIWGLQIFDSIYVMTKGGPLEQTRNIVYQIYMVSFREDNMGTGAALSVIFLFVILIISVIQMKLFKSDVEY